MRNLIFVVFAFLLSVGCSVVDPGQRGIVVTLGKVEKEAYPEGLVWIFPFTTSVEKISIKQNTVEMMAECFSSDMQIVNVKLNVLYRIPEKNVVDLFQKYSGNVFNSLIAPRVSEALKEVTAVETAESIVKQREKIKQAALANAKAKIGDLLFVEDVVIVNISLSKELEAAIESKMVQQQEAAKAQFMQDKAKIEASTALIRANGEANAIRAKGLAIKENPQLIDLMTIEKWNGVSPLVVGDTKGNMLLPLTQK